MYLNSSILLNSIHLLHITLIITKIITKITNFLSKFSFKNTLGLIIRRFLKIFFSDRRTGSILKLFSVVFGGFRFFNALLGFLILINMKSFTGFFDITNGIKTFFILLRDNYYNALNKFWPTHPKVPSNVQQTIHKISDKIDNTPIIKKAEQQVDNAYFSLRDLYRNPPQPIEWFKKHVLNQTDDYSIFTDWKFYLGFILIAGLLYVAVPFLYHKYQTPSLNHKKDDDAPTDAAFDHETPLPLNFFKRFYRFIANIVTKNDPKAKTLPKTPERVFPDAPTDTPVSNRKGFYQYFKEHSPWFDKKGKGKATSDDMSMSVIDKEIAKLDPQNNTQPFAVGESTRPQSPVSPTPGCSGNRFYNVPLDDPGDSTIRKRPVTTTEFFFEHRDNPYEKVREELFGYKAIQQMSNTEEWSDVFQTKSESLIKELLNKDTKEISKPNIAIDQSSDVYSDIGSDTTPDLVSDKTTSTDDSVYN